MEDFEFKPEDEFRIEMPAEVELVKSISDQGTGRRIVRGYASSENVDQDGEIVLQKGIDFAPLKKNGFLNWDHQYIYPVPGVRDIRIPLIIGYPTEVLMKSKGLWLEGELLQPGVEATPELRIAEYVWQLGTNLQKSGSDRRLAYSVEGGILQRRGKKVAKSLVRAAAITWKPVNPDMTIEMFQKSLCCGKCSPDHPQYNPAHKCSNKHVEVESLPALEKSIETNAMSTDSAEALLKQNLDRGMSTVLYGEQPDECYEPNTGRFKNGLQGAVKHMTDCLGYGQDDSKNFLRKLIKAAENNAGIYALVKSAGLLG